MQLTLDSSVSHGEVATPPPGHSELWLRARDDYPLAASLFEPIEADEGRVALIASAMACRRQLYEPFARYLNRRGWTVVTFDYRGIGDSRHTHPIQLDAGLIDWAEKDIAGVLDWIHHYLSPRHLVVVAHSIGGQIMGLAPNHERLSAMLTVGSGKVYWQHWEGLLRYGVRASWLAVPHLVRCLGYFPRWLANAEEDLTAEMLLDWWRWAAQPGYRDAAGTCLAQRFAAFTSPILALSFADDRVWAPPATVEALLEIYANARSVHHHLHPDELGLARVGHSGFFAPEIGAQLWDWAASWLEEPS